MRWVETFFTFFCFFFNVCYGLIRVTNMEKKVILLLHLLAICNPHCVISYSCSPHYHSHSRVKSSTRVAYLMWKS